MRRYRIAYKKKKKKKKKVTAQAIFDGMRQMARLFCYGYPAVKAPKKVAHSFQIAKEEEKELVIIDGPSKDNIYTNSEINNSINAKWCSLYICGSYHLAKDCPTDEYMSVHYWGMQVLLALPQLLSRPLNIACTVTFLCRLFCYVTPVIFGTASRYTRQMVLLSTFHLYIMNVPYMADT